MIARRVTQHLRRLKAMNYDPPGHFIISVLELKLDANAMFEWQSHSQESLRVPHFSALLDFICSRAQASESLTPDFSRKHHPNHDNKKRPQTSRPVTMFVTTVSTACIACGTVRHALYTCPKFRSLPHEQMCLSSRVTIYVSTV